MDYVSFDYDEALKRMSAGDPTLTEAIFSPTQSASFIDAPCLNALAAALPNSKLTKLNISGTHFLKHQGGAEAIAALAKAIPQSLLRELVTYECNLGPEGAKLLAPALENSPLTHWQAGGNDIDDEGAKAIAATLQKSSLTMLCLRNNKIGVEGAKALAAALPYSRVIELDLVGNHNIPQTLQWQIEDILATNKARLARGEEPPAPPGALAPTPVIAEISPAQRIYADQREELRNGVGGF